MTDILDDSRKEGNENDGENDEKEIFSDRGNIPEKITPKNKESDPRNSPHHVIDQKMEIRHRANAGHERGKGADDRHKTREDDRLSAVARVK